MSISQDGAALTTHVTWQTEGLETTTLKLQLPLMMSCAGYIGLMKLMNISEPWWPQLELVSRERDVK